MKPRHNKFSFVLKFNSIDVHSNGSDSLNCKFGVDKCENPFGWPYG